MPLSLYDLNGNNANSDTLLNEISNRISTDEAISAALSMEMSIRNTNNSILSTTLSTEISTRISADTAISTVLSGLTAGGVMASDVQLVANNFNKNLDNSITDVQKLADKVDDLTLGGGGSNLTATDIIKTIQMGGIL